jgi:acyl-CoA reductase-like NAD-dependent aldehyde dehydrogenase
VQRIVNSEFVEKLVKKVKSLRLGNPLQVSTFVGPLINLDAYRNYQRIYSRKKEEIESFFKSIETEVATLITL